MSGAFNLFEQAILGVFRSTLKACSSAWILWRSVRTDNASDGLFSLNSLQRFALVFGPIYLRQRFDKRILGLWCSGTASNHEWIDASALMNRNRTEFIIFGCRPWLLGLLHENRRADYQRKKTWAKPNLWARIALKAGDKVVSDGAKV